jgi:hypothetical protein
MFRIVETVAFALGLYTNEVFGLSSNTLKRGIGAKIRSFVVGLMNRCNSRGGRSVVLAMHLEWIIQITEGRPDRQGGGWHAVLSMMYVVWSPRHLDAIKFDLGNPRCADRTGTIYQAAAVKWHLGLIMKRL